MTENPMGPDENNVTAEIIETTPEQTALKKPGKTQVLIRILLAILIFGSGLGGGYLLRIYESAHIAANKMTAMVSAINPQDGFKIQAKFGDVGPKLLSSGAIDLASFEQLYQQSGHPLTEEEIEQLTKGSQDQIVITRENARFLLNFFWALGLTNKNPVLDSGPIQQASGGQIAGYASTGGWTIGVKPVTDLFSSTEILVLSAEQQVRVEDVAKTVYRPCCDNPTHFPDCNHGMAMLGLLELMASQNASTDEMFLAAKSANAFWFMQQTLEQALFFKTTQKVDYAKIAPKLIVGQQYSSLSGFQNTHQWLAENGLLEQLPKSGNNCGV